ncbi:MAG TPA: PEP-CTERM sorting domain-containing protein [Caldimonas sp.]|nr:PEP-CTERM sorting domain-containing protein [Caldimonas sp.]
MNWKLSRLAAALSILAAPSAWADDPFFFSTGGVTNAIGMASRPDVGGKTEIEAADDFVTTASTTLASATFTGLVTSITGTSTIGEVVVEIYRVFPLDSNTVRTPNVPTRANSPSDVALDSRSSSVAGEMSFATATLAATFTASNSVLNGIHPSPNQLTMGEGAVTGREVQFTVNFAKPLVLPADHYFFIPQVQVTGGEFYWLSGTRPIVAPAGTPFAPDLQAWMRNEALDPDWLRAGTDIVGTGTFNGAFTLSGTVAAVPEPETGALMLLGLAAVGGIGRRRRAAAPGR